MTATDSEKPSKTKKARISILSILIACAGILVNLVLIPELQRDAPGQYENHLENLKIYADSSDSFMLNYRIGLYNLDKASVIFAVVCIVAFILCIFLQKIRPLHLIIPIGGIAFSVYSASILKDFRDINATLLFAGFVGCLILALVFTIIGVISGKARFALFAGISSILSFGCYFVSTGSYLLQNIVIANVIGADVVFFFALLTLRKPKAKPVSTPVPAPVSPVSESPVPSVATPVVNPITPNTNGSLVLSSDMLIIDEKVSMGKKSFKILNEQGTEIGFVKENISGGANASRVLLGKGTAIFQSSQFLVCESDGTPLLGVSKEGLYGSVTDINGNIICTLKKNNLLDPSGNSLMRFRSTLKEGMFVETLDGQRIANFKKAYFTAKAMFTAADKYTVTFTPGTPVNQRILAIGTVLIWEMITGNK